MRGKYEREVFGGRKSVSIKSAAILLTLVLVLSIVIGGTMAWLMDKTDPVTNTFTAGNIEITLIETKKPDGTVVDAGVTDWSAQMIPGNTYEKDPVVTVIGSENAVDCYLFVKVEEVGNAQEYLNYTFTFDADAEWKKYGEPTTVDETTTTIWYREVTASTDDQSWHLLTDDRVTVDGDAVTKNNMTVAANAKLIFTAYAAQKDNRKVDQAWKLFNP